MAYEAVVESCQRQGAVANMTTSEYQQGQLRKGVYAIRVKEHKTSVMGSAMVVMGCPLKERCDQYLGIVRPLIQ